MGEVKPVTRKTRPQWGPDDLWRHIYALKAELARSVECEKALNEVIAETRQQLATVTAERECDADTIDKLRIRADKAEDERDLEREEKCQAEATAQEARQENAALEAVVEALDRYGDDDTMAYVEDLIEADAKTAALEAVVKAARDVNNDVPTQTQARTLLKQAFADLDAKALSSLPKNQPAEGGRDGDPAT